MAEIIKRRRVTVDSDAEDPQLPALPDMLADQEPEPEDVALTNMLADLGAGDDVGRVHVYKLAGGEFRRQVFLFDCLPSEFSMTMLQDPAYHEDGHHSFQVVARGRTGIKMSKRLEAMPNKAAALGSAAQAIDTAQIITPIMQAIAAQNEQTNKLIAALAGAQQPQKTTSDILNEMLLMKQIIGSEQRAAPAGPNPIELMRSVVELSREIAQPEGNATNADVMVKLMEKFGGPILEAVAANQAAPVARPMPMIAPQAMPVQPQPQVMPTQPQPQAMSTQPQPQAMPTQPQPQPQPEEETEDMSIKLRMALSFLVKQAKDDADPDLYAALVLDQAGDEIANYLNMPNWFDLMCQLNSDVAQHQKWFHELRDSIIRQLTESPENDTSATIETNGGANATANGNNLDTPSTP